MLDIYTEEGLLDRSKVLARLDEVLAWPRGQSAASMRTKLADLLDEVAEGFDANPLDAPDMVRDHLAACARDAVKYNGPHSATLRAICHGVITGDKDGADDWGMMGPAL